MTTKAVLEREQRHACGRPSAPSRSDRAEVSDLLGVGSAAEQRQIETCPRSSGRPQRETFKNVSGHAQFLTSRCMSMVGE